MKRTSPYSFPALVLMLTALTFGAGGGASAGPPISPRNGAENPCHGDDPPTNCRLVAPAAGGDAVLATEWGALSDDANDANDATPPVAEVPVPR